MHRHVLASCAVVLSLAAGSPAAAQDASPSDLLDGVRASMQSASALLAAGDRVGAVGALDEAVAGAATLDANDLSTAAARRKVGRLVTTLRKRLKDAMRRTNDAAVQPLAAQRAIGRAVTAASAAAVARDRAEGAPFLLQEVAARSAGIHGPGQVIEFRVNRSAACDEEPVVTIVDVAGGAVVVQPVQIVGAGTGPRFFDVSMGDAAGAARVEVSLCGETRTWLLNNKGPDSGYPVLPPPEVSRFDGAYDGAYQGRATAQGVSQAVSGGVSFTVQGGRITITSPGSGRGSLSASGRSRFAGGSGGTGSSSYGFQGVFTEWVVGGTTAGGNWTSTFRGGSARGTWSASRIGP